MIIQAGRVGASTRRQELTLTMKSAGSNGSGGRAQSGFRFALPTLLADVDKIPRSDEGAWVAPYHLEPVGVPQYPGASFEW